ncbi:MAG: 30S ribosomal protein S6 [Planctomycetota bacterium]
MTERLYEALFLVDAVDATQAWTELETNIRGIIDQHGGVIEHAEKWPEQRLAYEVKGSKRGVYYLTYFRSDSQSVSSIRADAQLFERILRLLVLQEPYLEELMKKRQEVAARRAAEPVKATSEETAESTSNKPDEDLKGAKEPVATKDVETPAAESALDHDEPAEDSEPDPPEAEGSEPEDSGPEDSEPEDSEPEDSEPQEPEPEESEPEDSEPQEPEPEDSEPEEPEPEDPVPEEPEPEESVPEESEPEDEVPEQAEDAGDTDSVEDVADNKEEN